jgi:hypothetical protein
MRNRRWWMAGFSIVMVAGAVRVWAAEPPKMTPEQQAAMEKAMKLGSPSEGHKALEPFAGKWTNSVKYWMKPGDKAQESKGTNENAWILGGRFLKQDYQGTMADGKPFEGLGITGYDNVRGEYQSLWLDSMMTGMMVGTGSFDAAAKTVKVAGTFSCPMTGEKAMWYRYEWKVINNDHHTYTSYGKTPDGKEFKSMVIEFTRVKA